MSTFALEDAEITEQTDGMKPREVNLYNLALHGQRQLLLGRLANNQYVAPNDDQHVGVVTGPAGLPVPADPLSCAAMGADGIFEKSLIGIIVADLVQSFVLLRPSIHQVVHLFAK